MDYLIRFAQVHETFRRPELQALATMTGVDFEILSYSVYSPYCIVRLQNDVVARALVARSILVRDIFELWGTGASYDELHEDVRRRTQDRWEDYRRVSFRFNVESFAGTRSMEEKNTIIQSFAYLGLDGPIRMKDPAERFWVLEEYTWDVEALATGLVPSTQAQAPSQKPVRIYFGRWLAESSRGLVAKYDLKKRRYISTTSMDAELSLITANIACAQPGKLFFDPFVGTGSFCVAAANFGALTFGSDIDGRSFRGSKMADGMPMGLFTNFQQYGLASKFVDAFTSDLTNTSICRRPFLDGIVCDPPYGVREGLRVLGTRDGHYSEVKMIDGIPSYYRPGYIPPKKPYGFEAMLNDILTFAAATLVTDGRLSMWMPTANDEDAELVIPMHPNLEVISICVQDFGRWARRLITYRRLPEGELSNVTMAQRKGNATGSRANDLNEFRKKYFTSSSERSANNQLKQCKDGSQEQC